MRIALSPEEELEQNKQAMGEKLGKLYTVLSRELVWLYRQWYEYGALYGTKQSRVDILNRSASDFFAIVQDLFFSEIHLGISRLTDPAATGKKHNLSLQQLPLFIQDEELKGAVSTLADDLFSKAAPARDWRNRFFAHHDLPLALGSPCEPLKQTTYEVITTCLATTAEILNRIQAHYMDGSTTNYTVIWPGDGAEDLLHVLREGLRRIDEHEEAIERGEYPPDIFSNDLGPV